MPWGTWTLGTETTMRLGTTDVPTSKGAVFSGNTAPELTSLLSSPMTAGLIELKNNRFVAAGTAPDFPVLPKWRKVVRQIG